MWSSPYSIEVDSMWDPTFTVVATNCSERKGYIIQNHLPCRTRERKCWDALEAIHALHCSVDEDYHSREEDQNQDLSKHVIFTRQSTWRGLSATLNHYGGSRTAWWCWNARVAPWCPDRRPSLCGGLETPTPNRWLPDIRHIIWPLVVYWPKPYYPDIYLAAILNTMETRNAVVDHAS